MQPMRHVAILQSCIYTSSPNFLLLLPLFYDKLFYDKSTLFMWYANENSQAKSLGLNGMCFLINLTLTISLSHEICSNPHAMSPRISPWGKFFKGIFQVSEMHHGNLGPWPGFQALRFTIWFTLKSMNLPSALLQVSEWTGEPKPSDKNLDTKNHHTVQHDFDSNLESVWMLQGCHRKRLTHFQPNRTPGAMAADWSSVQFQNRRGASWNDGGGACGLSKGPDSVSWGWVEVGFWNQFFCKRLMDEWMLQPLTSPLTLEPSSHEIWWTILTQFIGYEAAN